jgi:hypothetical protein
VIFLGILSLLNLWHLCLQDSWLWTNMASWLIDDLKFLCRSITHFCLRYVWLVTLFWLCWHFDFHSSIFWGSFCRSYILEDPYVCLPWSTSLYKQACPCFNGNSLPSLTQYHSLHVNITSLLVIQLSCGICLLITTIKLLIIPSEFEKDSQRTYPETYNSVFMNTGPGLLG